MPQLTARAGYLKQSLRDKLLEHHAYVRQWGDDVPAIKNWRWGGAAGRRKPGRAKRKADTAADNL